MNKRCERDDCRFIHDAKLCHNFWKRGTCKWNENCRKNHFVRILSEEHPERQRVLQEDKGTKRDKKPKRVRNTESWAVPSAPYDMRVQFETSKEHLNCKLKPSDVLVAKNVFSDFSSGELHDRLVKEIQECDIPKDDLLKLWHGSEERGIEGKHHIVNDRTNWKNKCPTFNIVIDRLVSFFGVKPAATRMNWYKTHTEFKPMHFDSAYVNPEKAKTQNITIAVSFGQKRDIVFENAKSKQKICIEQGDNDVYLFMNDINSTYRHGVGQGVDEENSSRVSVIVWGLVDGVESSKN
jgi:hypothetical protein